MKSTWHFSLVFGLLLGFVPCLTTLAQDKVVAEAGESTEEAIELLDEATTAKLSAKTPKELQEVISLCEQALEKGLGEDDEMLAKDILAASALQRAKMLFQRLPRLANNARALENLRRQLTGDLEKAVANNPKLADAFVLLADLERLPGGSRAKAAEYLEKAVEIFEDKPVERSKVHLALAGLRQTNEARFAELDKAIKADPTNMRVREAKIQLMLALGKDEEVLADAEKMLNQDDSNLFAVAATAQAFFKLGRIEEAVNFFTQQIEKKPELGLLYRLRGRALLSQSKTDEALEDLNKALEINDRDPEALVLRGQAYLAKDETDKANRDISDALRINPNSVEGVLMRSLVSANEGRVRDAIKDMELLVRANPSNEAWILQLGQYYLMDNRPRLTMRLMDELLEENKEAWRAMRMRGDAKLGIGMHKEAIADYETAIKIAEKTNAVAPEEEGEDVDLSGLLNNLSWVLSTSTKDDLRDGKKALEYAEKACEITEYAQAHILSTLAAAHAELGDFEKALKWANKAVEVAAAEENPQLDQLKEEVESYKEKKPWREEQQTEENDKPLSTANQTIDT